MSNENNKIVLVLDCGATNLRAAAVDEHEEILAQKSFPNKTSDDPNHPGGLIWDVDDIWNKLAMACMEVTSKINKNDIVGICVTSFGVDGAAMKKSGKMLYPVISWACQRTAPIMKNIEEYIPLEHLYELSGVNEFSFNTINKFLWFKENRPEILDQMEYFVFMPSLVVYKLCGAFITDTSMAGTSMMTDIHKRNFSAEILKALDVENKFPPLVEAGNIVGKINAGASKEIGVPVGVPVVAAGHDTQFAVYGSGINENEVVLSSGTWEILMARTSIVRTDMEMMQAGLTTEFDVIPGLYNPGIQWLGSGILERIRQTYYSKESKQENIYDLMIHEAEDAATVKSATEIDFMNIDCSLSGFAEHKRGEIYRAVLEALAKKTRQSLEILEQAGGFKAKSLIVVGGGSKNRLWNKLREAELGIPVKTIKQKETTVLGAAQMAFKGLAQ